MLTSLKVDPVASMKAEWNKGLPWRLSHRTYVFAIHVVEEAQAVGGRVGDAVGVLGRHVEVGAKQSRLFALLAWPGRLDVHVEAWKKHKAALG